MSKNNDGFVGFDITQPPSDNDAGNEDITFEETHESESDSDTKSKEDKGEKKSTSPSDKSKGSNKSNWKKMQESSKAKDRRIAELEAQLAKKGSNDDQDEDDSDSDDFEPNYDKADLLEFLIDNDAKDYKAGIVEALDEYPGISFDKALKLAKASGPDESESYDMFSTKSSENSVRTKKLKDLTREEAYEHLNFEQLDKWQKINEKEVNPFG